jgi:DNA processing protein
MACDLSNQGLSIISGLARGVDTAARRGVSNAKGRTVGVMGAGVDEIYPRENKRLAEQILAMGGTLIPEFAVGAPPTPQNFPIRNRIISGMSVGVLVVEAVEYGGADHGPMCIGAITRSLCCARQFRQPECVGPNT